MILAELLAQCDPNVKYQLKNENGWMHRRLVRRKSDMERGKSKEACLA